MKLTEAMVMLTVTCAQLAGNAGVVVWSPDAFNRPQREGNAEPKGSDKWSENREGGRWLRDVHMRGGGLAPPPLTRCVGCWWCKSGGAVHSPNASGGDAGQGLVVRRARQVVATAANDAQGKRRLYENLAQLTVDAINTLSIKYLSIYSGKAAGLLLMRWLSQRSSSIMWDVTPCSTSSSHPHSSADQVLILVLCDYDATVDVLSSALAWDQLREHTWFFLNLGQPLATRDPQLYIPIDSMVVEVRNPVEDIFVLHEVWSPGQRMKLKHALIAIWRAHAQDAGSSDEADGEAVATVGNEWPEKALIISTGRLTMSSRPKYERRKDLTGVHFVVTSINDTRAHNSRYDYVRGRDVLSGYFGDVWELLKNEMNFTYTVMTPADGEFGSNSKGYWTGLVADVLSGRAHVVVAYLSQTYSRAQVVDYSSVLIKFSYRIFARPPERSAVSWTSYTRPFLPGLWVGLALALVALATAFYCVSCFYRRQVSLSGGGAGGGRSDEGFQQWQVDSPLIMWAAITQQGWPDTPEAGALRVLFWTMYVVGVVVVAAYSATLVSFLTVAGDQLPFDSLADLKMLPKYRLGILKGSRLEEYFKNKNFLEYWEALIEPYSDTLMKSYKELRSHALEDSGYAYVGTYEIQRLDPVGACTFRSARQHLLFNDGALGWPRGSPYVQVFDHFISKFRESGLLKKMMDVWYPRPYSCPQQPVIPLGFKQVFTAFVMLGTSAALSLLLLGLEKIFNWCRYEQLRAQV
ncbi:glutamate receptor ionotropic, kainate 1-like [Panulirus ornatus]|uniref:glutamate receptor ionotropic, kainate 1-like n=1 Tax=Panulirus ornatus TaxID=150431 RepID=UPI003A869BBF